MSDAIHKVGETARVAKGAADGAASRGSQGHIGLPQMILATGGGAAGAAFLGGTLAGPIGAVVGTGLGVGIGVYLYTTQSHR